jgi:SAM-dependent methyltransferase
MSTFDVQADRFDARTGFSEESCRQIADAIAATARLREGDRLLEIGAGTGQLGLELLRRGFRHIALDLSSRMLEVFRRKLRPEGLAASLIRADAADFWPLAAGTVRMVFGSRSFHRLEPAHVVREALRVADPKEAFLLVGRVRREPTSVRSRLREEMRRRVGATGIPARSGERETRLLLEACHSRGAGILSPRSVARWTVRESPLSSLESWRAGAGLAGCDVAEERKLAILEGLRSWAQEAFGRLDAESDSEETYVLEGACLTAAT